MKRELTQRGILRVVRRELVSIAGLADPATREREVERLHFALHQSTDEWSWSISEVRVPRSHRALWRELVAYGPRDWTPTPVGIG